MKILLLGSTGMLGQALYVTLSKKYENVLTMSRKDAQYCLDVRTDEKEICEIILQEQPDIVINAIAIVDLKYCEENKEQAYIVNARFPGILANVCKEVGSYFIQISTDHYFLEKENTLHCEDADVKLVNEYARTKYIGECLAQTYKESLIVRTNIVGFRNQKGRPTFIEWVIQQAQEKQSIIGYADYFTSSIDIYCFSKILLELLDIKYTGVLNIASTTAISKYDFICRFLSVFGLQASVTEGRMEKSSPIIRANTLGLDTQKLAKILRKNKVPSIDEVIENLYTYYLEELL